MFKACTSPVVSSVTLGAILPDLEQLATQTGLITRRTPHFSAEGFLLTLLKAVSTGQASFSQMAATLGDSEIRTLSRQALHQGLKSPTITFLHSVGGGHGFPANHAVKERRASLQADTVGRRHPVQDASEEPSLVPCGCQ